MRCCSCNIGTLLPTRIDTDGPAGYVCNQCTAVLLSLAPYLDWVRSRAPSSTADVLADSFEGDIKDSKRALSCPKCSRIMLRFNVLADKAHGLDYCFHCEEVWLDPGEWHYLKSHGLHQRINTIATEPYQRRLREQALRDAAQQRFRDALGEPVYEEVQRFAEWLREQPARESILRHLGNEVR